MNKKDLPQPDTRFVAAVWKGRTYQAARITLGSDCRREFIHPIAIRGSRNAFVSLAVIRLTTRLFGPGRDATPSKLKVETTNVHLALEQTTTVS